MRKTTFYAIAGSLLVMTGLLLVILLPGTLWLTQGTLMIWVGFYCKGHSSLLLGKKDNSTIWKRD